MPRPEFPRSIVDFQDRFATEEDCREYLFASRWPEGFGCRRCGGGEIGVMHRRRVVWQCKGCGAQTSVTAGTVMHGTRQPLRLWFWAAYLSPPTIRGSRPCSCSASSASVATRPRG